MALTLLSGSVSSKTSATAATSSMCASNPCPVSSPLLAHNNLTAFGSSENLTSPPMVTCLSDEKPFSAK